MSKIFFLKIIYKNAVSLHKITSTVESVNGAKIKHLNFISKGKSFVGVIAFEATQMIDFERIFKRIRRNRNISDVEQIMDTSFC